EQFLGFTERQARMIINRQVRDLYVSTRRRHPAPPARRPCLRARPGSALTTYGSACLFRPRGNRGRATRSPVASPSRPRRPDADPAVMRTPTTSPGVTGLVSGGAAPG